jgi:CheY-like chemotaxis protein
VTHDQLSSLAHDLKTPIAVICGYAELLALRDDDATRDEAAAQILQAAYRLSELIDEALPASADDVDFNLARGGSADASAPQRAWSRPARIAIVDDDSFVRRLVRLTLPPDDFELAEASDGDTALGLVETHASDLVLLDWRMPRVSGEEVLRQLKERDASLPVIVVTADSDERSVAKALGADVFLTKPFSPLELLETIERLLGDRTADRAA